MGIGAPIAKPRAALSAAHTAADKVAHDKNVIFHRQLSPYAPNPHHTFPQCSYYAYLVCLKSFSLPTPPHPSRAKICSHVDQLDLYNGSTEYGQPTPNTVPHIRFDHYPNFEPHRTLLPYRNHSITLRIRDLHYSTHKHPTRPRLWPQAQDSCALGMPEAGQRPVAGAPQAAAKGQGGSP